MSAPLSTTPDTLIELPTAPQASVENIFAFETKSEYAWVTLLMLGDSYSDGLLTFLFTLVEIAKTKYDMIRHKLLGP